MRPWEITFEAVLGDAVWVQPHSSAACMNHCLIVNSKRTYTIRNFFWHATVTRKEAFQYCTRNLALFLPLSQELAGLSLAAVDNLPEEIVGWRWYSSSRRRYKAEAYIYSITLKRPSSPWTIVAAQFKCKVTSIFMFYHPWIPLLSPLILGLPAVLLVSKSWVYGTLHTSAGNRYAINGSWSTSKHLSRH
jgi:hypothetical protein